MEKSEKQHLVILCVDDDADIRTIVSLSLQLDGWMTVHLADTASEAQALLLGGLHVDVALVDAPMPEVGGIDLVRIFKRMDGKSPSHVIMLTAAVHAQDRLAFEAAGADDVIMKPFDPLTLALQLRQIFSQVSISGN